MRAFLAKRLDGSFVAACETSEAYARRVSPGEAIEVDLKTRNTRSVRWHRKYFALCTLIYNNVERIQMPNGDYIEFTSVEVVHMTLKGLAGLYDSMITMPDGTRLGLVRSIAFDNMNADEWAIAWSQILDAVHKHVLPSVKMSEIENEIARIAA
jgi:hypothetical protein